jgi:dolichyl-phosphate beta-glucosyltransferase
MQRLNNVNSNLCITIIIPARNEEKRITTCLTRTLQYCTEQRWSFEIIVAVDGSIDHTAKIVQNFHSIDNRVKLLSFKSRLGKGRAIINAIRMASNNYIAYIDADLSADPSELIRLLEYVDNYDIVVGSRVLRGNLPPIKRPIVRSFFSHVYSIAFRLLFRLQIYDSQCGLMIFRRHAVSNILPEIDSTGLSFDSELLVIASIFGLRIKEVPINWSDYIGPKTDIIKQTAVMGTGLLLIWKKVYILQLKNKKHMHVQNEKNQPALDSV